MTFLKNMILRVFMIINFNKTTLNYYLNRTKLILAVGFLLAVSNLPSVEHLSVL